MIGRGERNGNPLVMWASKYSKYEPPPPPPDSSAEIKRPKARLRIHPYALGFLLGKGVAILTTLGAAACFVWAFWTTAPWSVVGLLLTLILSAAIVSADSAKGKTP